MKRNEAPGTERLIAADPALVVTESELARSREKSLAVLDTDAEHITVGGSVTDFHQHPAGRRGRLTAGFGLLAAAAAAVVAGVVVTSSMTTPPTDQAVPAATQPDAAEEPDSPGFTPLPEITGLKAATGNAIIVTGDNDHKAAVSTDEEVNVFMDALNSGKLGLNSRGCFANISVEDTSGGLIFPFGTRVTESGVVLPDGTLINIGDEFAFGGGSIPGNTDLSECFPGGGAFLAQSWRTLP